jgi:hypothetical protein
MELTFAKLTAALFIKISTAPRDSARSNNYPPAVGAALLRKYEGQENSFPYGTNEQVQRTAELARVTSVTLGGITLDESGSVTYGALTIYEPTEAQLLVRVQRVLNNRRERGSYELAGYGVRSFDAPFLTKRLLAVGLALPECLHLQDRKPWDSGLIDASDTWSGGRWQDAVPLALFCFAVVPELTSELSHDFALATYRATDLRGAEQSPTEEEDKLSKLGKSELTVLMKACWKLAQSSPQ